VTRFIYDSYEIKEGKQGLKGLPATFGEADSASTLLVYLKDEVADLRVTLSYAVFPECNAFVRSWSIENCGKEEVVIENAASFSVDLDHVAVGREMIQLSGEWAREAQIVRRKIQPGFQGCAKILPLFHVLVYS
jgi:alpha-galactosidase